MTNCPDTSNASDASLSRRQRRWTWAVSIALVLAVFAVFGQTVRFDFINFDDNVLHLQESPGLPGTDDTEHHLGLHPKARGDVAAADVAVADGGLRDFRPPAARRVSLHQRAAARPDGGLAVSGLAADDRPALAVRVCRRAVRRAPAAAESVAWITERKDVLSSVFFMLVLGAYVGTPGGRFPSSATRQ